MKLKKIYQYYFTDIANFKKFWLFNKKNKNIPKELRNIINIFISSPSFVMCSKYWEFLNIKNIRQIINDGGIKNYSNTIATNYFTILDIDKNMEKKMLSDLSDINIDIKGQIFKTNKYFGLQKSDNLNRLLLKLYVIVKSLGYEKYLKQLSDKGFTGFNDHYLTINSIKITNDKLISILDYIKIKKYSDLKKVNSVLEIGAGSGRFSETYMTFNKNCKYIICDIPPSIYINYLRQKKVFSQKKIKLCFDIQSEYEFLEYYKNNDILFIFPHQISLLKNIKIDLSVAIDCFHEMDKKTIWFYMNRINEFSKYLYFSVWEYTSVPFSSYFKVFQNKLMATSKKDYQIPKSWRLVGSSNLIFPENYKALYYKI